MIQKDNLVYALGGMVIGIMAGVFLANQTAVPRAAEQQVSAPVQQQQRESEGALPQGHPPVNDAALREQLAINNSILEKDPENQQALVNAANINSDLKQYPQAIVLYERALKKDSNNINLITDLATSYFYSNDPNKALELYGRSLSLDPKHFQTLMNIGIVKMAVGDKAGAAEAWEKVVSYHPDRPEATQLKGMITQLKQNS